MSPLSMSLERGGAPGSRPLHVTKRSSAAADLGTLANRFDSTVGTHIVQSGGAAEANSTFLQDPDALVVRNFFPLPSHADNRLRWGGVADTILGRDHSGEK